MHELSVARDLVEVVSKALDGDAPVGVRTVRLRLGPLSGVVATSLLFAFDAATDGTALQGSTLQIEEVSPAVYCRRCRAERELASVQRLRCPVCGTHTPDVVRGRELEVASVEVIDAVEAPAPG